MNNRILIIDDQRHAGPDGQIESASESFRVLLKSAGGAPVIEDGYVDGVQIRDAQMLAQRVFARMKSEDFGWLIVDLLWPSGQIDFGERLLVHLLDDFGCLLPRSQIFVHSIVIDPPLKKRLSLRFRIPENNIHPKDRKGREQILGFFRNEFLAGDRED